MANSRNQKELEDILDVLETFDRYSEVEVAPIIAKGIEKIFNTPANLVLSTSSSSGGGGEGGNTSASHLLLLEAQNALFRSLGAITREVDLDVGVKGDNDGDRAGVDTSSSVLVGVHTRHAAKLIEYVKTICQKDRVNMQGKAANVTVALESAMALIGRQRISPSLIHLTALPHPVKSNDISARLAAIRFVPCLNGIASGSGAANHVYTIGGAGVGGSSSSAASALRYQYQLGGTNGSSSLSSFYTSPAVGEGATTAIFNEEVFVYLVKGLEGKDFRIRDACLKALNKGTVYYNLMFSPTQCAKLLEILPRVADDTSATSNEAAEDCGQILGLALSAIAKSKIHTFCLLNNGGGVGASSAPTPSTSSVTPSASSPTSIFASHHLVLSNVLAPILHFFTLQFSSLIMTRRRQTMLAVALGGLLATLKIAPSSAVQAVLDHHHQVSPQTASTSNTATATSSLASNVFSSTAAASFLMSHLLAPTVLDEKVYGPRLFSRAFQVWSSTSSSVGSSSVGIETEDDWQSFGKFLAGKLKFFISLSVAIGGKRGTQAVVSAAVGGDGGASLTSYSPNAASAGGGVTSSTSSIVSLPQIHHNSGGSTLFTIGSSFPVHTLSIPPHTVAQHRNAALAILHAIGTFSRGSNLFSLPDLSQMANAAMQVLLLQVLQQQHHHHAASSPSPNSLFPGNGSTPTNGAPRGHNGGASSGVGAGANGNGSSNSGGGSLVSLHTAASETLSEMLRSPTTGFGFAVHHKLYEFCGQCLDLGLTHPLLLALRALSYSPYQYPSNKMVRFVTPFGPNSRRITSSAFTNKGTISTTTSSEQHDEIWETTTMSCSHHSPPPPPPAPEVGLSLYFSILKSLSPSANITDKRIELFHLAAAAIIESLDSKRKKTRVMSKNTQNKNNEENVRGMGRKGGEGEDEENDVDDDDDDGHILADTCQRYIVPNAMTHLTYLSQKANTSSRTYNNMNNHNNNANDSMSTSTTGGGGAAAVPAGTWRAVAAVAKTLLLISKKKVLCCTSPTSVSYSYGSSSPFGFDEVMVSHLLLWAVTGTIASASATTLKGLIAVAELAAHIVTTSSFSSARSALISAMGAQNHYRSNTNGTTTNRRNHLGLGGGADDNSNANNDIGVFDEFPHHVPCVSSPTRIAFEARAAHKKRREAEAIIGLVELGSAEGHEERAHHHNSSSSSPSGHVPHHGRGPFNESQEKEKPSAHALDAFDSFFDGCGGERKTENRNQGGGDSSYAASSSAAVWGARSSISVGNIGGNLLNSVVLEFAIRAAQRAIDVFLFASRENIPCVVGGGFGVDLINIDAEGEYSAENHFDDSGYSFSRDCEGDEEDHFFDRSINYQPTRGEDWGELLFGPSPSVTSGIASFRLQRPPGASPNSHQNNLLSSPSSSSELLPPATYPSAVLRNYNAIIPASLAQQAYAALLRRNSKIFSQLTNVKAVASEIDSTGTDLPTAFLHNALATGARLASLRDGGSLATAVSSSASAAFAASPTGGSASVVVVEDVPAFNLLIFAHDKLKSLSALIEKQILQREAQKDDRRRQGDSSKKLTQQQQQQQQQQQSKEASWRRSKFQNDINVASAVLVNATMTRQSAFGWSEAIKLAMGQSISIPIRMLGEQCLRQLSTLVSQSEIAEGSISGNDMVSSQQPVQTVTNNNNNNHSLAFTSVLLSAVLESEKEKSLTVGSQRQPSPTPTSSNPASPLYLSAEREVIVRTSKMALASLFIPSLHSFSSANAINNANDNPNYGNGNGGGFNNNNNNSSQITIATNAMAMANPARVIEVCSAVLRSFCAESPIALTVAHHCLRAILGSLEAHAVVSCSASSSSTSSSSSAPSSHLSQASSNNSFSSLFLDKCLPSLWLLRFDPLVDLLTCDILLLSNKIDESRNKKNNSKEREEREKLIRRATVTEDDSFFENSSRPQLQGVTSVYRANGCAEDDEKDRELRIPVVSANFFNSQEDRDHHYHNNNGLEEREIVSPEAKLMTYLALSKAAEGLGSNTCSFAGSAATSVASLDAGGYSFLAKLSNSNNKTNSVSGVVYHDQDKNEEQINHRFHLCRMQGYNAFNGGISGSGYCCVPRYAPPSLIESVIAPFLFDSIRDEDIGTPLCDGSFILGIAQSLISRQSSSSSSARPLRIDRNPTSLPSRLPNPRLLLLNPVDPSSSPLLTPATGRMFLNLLLSHSWRVLANPNEPFLPALEAVLVPAATLSSMAALRASGSEEEDNEDGSGSFLHDLRDALTGRSRLGGAGGVGSLALGGGGGAPPAVGAIVTKALVMGVCIELFGKLLEELNSLKSVLVVTTTMGNKKNNNNVTAITTQNTVTTAVMSPSPTAVAAAVETVAPSRDGLDMFGDFSSPSPPSSLSENVMFTADPTLGQGQGGHVASNPIKNAPNNDDDDDEIYSSHQRSPYHHRKRQHHLDDPTFTFPTSARGIAAQARARKISNVLPKIWEILISALQLSDSHHLLTTIATDCVLRMLRAHKSTAETNASVYDSHHHHEQRGGNKQQQQSGAPSSKALMEVEKVSAFLANPSRLKELLPTIKSICDSPSPDVRVLDSVLATSAELIVVTASSSPPTSKTTSSSPQPIVNPPTPADVLKRLIACGISSLKISNIRTSGASVATATTSVAATTSSPLLSLQMSAVNLIIRCVDAAALNASMASSDTSSSAAVAAQGGARKHNSGVSQLQKQQQQQYLRVVTDFCVQQLNDGAQQQPVLAGLVAALAQCADILSSSLIPHLNLILPLSGEQHKKGASTDNSSTTTTTAKRGEEEDKLPITGMLIPVDPTAMITACERKIFTNKEAWCSSSSVSRRSPLLLLLSAFSRSIISFFDNIAPHLNPAAVLSYHPAIPDMLAIHIKTVVLVLASSLCCKSSRGKKMVEEVDVYKSLPLSQIPLRLIEVVFGANYKTLSPSPASATTQIFSRAKISLAKCITASALRVAAASAIDNCDESSKKETKKVRSEDAQSRKKKKRFIMNALQAVCSLVDRSDSDSGEAYSVERNERSPNNSVADLPFDDHLRSLLVTLRSTDSPLQNSSKNSVSTTSPWYRPLILELLMALNSASNPAQVSGKRSEQERDLNLLSPSQSTLQSLDSDVTTVVQALFLAAPSLPVALRLGTEMKIFSELSSTSSLTTPNFNFHKTVVMSIRKAVGEMSERMRQVYSADNNGFECNNRGASSTTLSAVLGEAVKLMIESFVRLHSQNSNFNKCEVFESGETFENNKNDNNLLLFSFVWLFSWANEVRCGGGSDLITGNGSLISLLGSWIERRSIVANQRRKKSNSGAHSLSLDHQEDDVSVMACSSLGAMSATIQALLLIRDLSLLSFGAVSPLPLETILRTAFVLQEQNNQQNSPQQQSFCLTPQVMLLAIALHNITISTAPSGSTTRTETLLSVLSQPMRELLQYGARHHTPAFKAVASKLGEANNEVLKACLTGTYAAANTPSMGVGVGVSPSGIPTAPTGNRLSSNACSTVAATSSPQTTSNSATVSLPPPPAAGGRLKINLGAFK